MKVTLEKIKSENFKGKTFELSKPSIIYGDNRVGKTTVADAFVWVFSGTTMIGSAKTEVKPLDNKNNIIHHKDVSVCLELDLDGQKRTIERRWIEDWGKIRNRPEQVLKGNYTEIILDGVPDNSANDLKKFVKEVFGVDIKFIPMLVIPENFCRFATKEWKEARKILTNIFNIDVDIDVDKKRFSKIAAGINKHGVEPYKKILRKERKDIEKSIGDSNTSIKTLKDKINPVPAGVEESEERLREVENQIADVLQGNSNTGEIDRLKEKRSDLKDQLRDLKRATILKYQDQLAVEENEKYNADRDVAKLNREIDEEHEEINRQNRRKEEFLERLEGLSREFDEIAGNIEKTGEVALNCPNCGYGIKGNEIDADFVDTLIERQKDINRKGIVVKSKISEADNKISSTETYIATLKDARRKAEIRSDKAENKIDAIKRQLKEPDTEDQVAVEKQIDDINSKIESLKNSKENSVDISDLQAMKENWQENLRVAKNNAEYLIDIENVNKTLAEKYNALDEVEFKEKEIDKFEREKALELQRIINNDFKLLSFQLFKDDGCLRPICEPMVNGVPFVYNANHEGKVNAGIEMIKKLQEYTGLKMPVFIDECESITKIFPLNGTQIIAFYKPEITTKKEMEYYSQLRTRKMRK